jgi:hypothetical protein
MKGMGAMALAFLPLSLSLSLCKPFRWTQCAFRKRMISISLTMVKNFNTLSIQENDLFLKEKKEEKEEKKAIMKEKNILEITGCWTMAGVVSCIRIQGRDHADNDFLLDCGAVQEGTLNAKVSIIERK